MPASKKSAKPKPAEPKCPECGIVGISHILSKESDEESEAGDTWFSVVYCDGCGHVYGVFVKHVLTHEQAPPPPILPRLPRRRG